MGVMSNKTMLRRHCPECNKKELRIPFFSSEFVCGNCFSKFKLTGFVSLFLLLFGAVFGTTAFYILVFFFNWVTLIIVFLVVPSIVYLISGFYGQLKITEVKNFSLHNKHS